MLGGDEGCSTLPPSVLPDISPTRGEIGRPLGFRHRRPLLRGPDAMPSPTVTSLAALEDGDHAARLDLHLGDDAGGLAVGGGDLAADQRIRPATAPRTAGSGRAWCSTARICSTCEKVASWATILRRIPSAWSDPGSSSRRPAASGRTRSRPPSSRSRLAGLVGAGRDRSSSCPRSSVIVLPRPAGGWRARNVVIAAKRAMRVLERIKRADRLQRLIDMVFADHPVDRASARP